MFDTFLEHLKLNVDVSVLGLMGQLAVYLFFAIAWWILFGDATGEAVYYLRKRRLNYLRAKGFEEKPVVEAVNKMMLSTYATRDNLKFYTNGFFYLTTTIFILVFVSLLLKLGPLYSLIMASLFASLPYLFLRVTLKRIQIEASRQTEIINTLIKCYKIADGDMYRALDLLIENTNPEHGRINKVFLKLSIELKDALSQDSRKKIIEQAIYSVNTRWMKRVAHVIYMSTIQGYRFDVTYALENTQEQIKVAHSRESAKSVLNLETKQLILMGVPSYIFGIWSLGLFNITVGVFLEWQLGTKNGLIFITSIVLLTIINLGIYFNFNKHKFDIS